MSDKRLNDIRDDALVQAANAIAPELVPGHKAGRGFPWSKWADVPDEMKRYILTFYPHQEQG